MKAIIALAVGAGLAGFMWFNYMQPTTYEASSGPVVVEKEVEVDNLEKRIKDAQDGAQSEIEARAQAEYDAVYEAEMAKVKASVLLEVEKEIEAQRLEVESQIQAY